MSSSVYPILDNRPIDQWKVTELKDELRRRKLPIKGLKEELVKRLAKAIHEEKESELSNEEELGNSSPENSIGHEEQNKLEKNDEIIDSSGVDAEDAANISESARDVLDSDQLVIDQDGSAIKVADGEVAEFTTDVLNTECCTDSVPSSFGELNSNLERYTSEVNNEDAKSVVQVDQAVFADVEDVPEDNKPDLLEPIDQVSAVSPDFDFRVKSESISKNTESINDNNELKDNLNIENFPLEIQDNRVDMARPSFSGSPHVDVEMHPLDDKKLVVENQAILEEFDGKYATDVNNSPKAATVDGGSPEKLNLDRSSSGDLSAEEDAVENKQVSSKNISNSVTKSLEDLKEFPMEEGVETVEESVVLSEKGKTNVDMEMQPGSGTEKRKLDEVVDADNESSRSNKLPRRLHRWKQEVIKPPESEETNINRSTAPMDVNQPALIRTISRSESIVSVKPLVKPTSTQSDLTVSNDLPKERVVPPSKKPETTSLKIERFLRPFTLKAVHELLGKTGKVCMFWMDNIKTHCYVTYSSVEEAVATRNAVFNLQWPPNGGRLLVAEFVDPLEVKAKAEAQAHPPTPVTPQPPTPVSLSPAAPILAVPPPQASHPQPEPRQRLARQQPPAPVSLPPPPLLSPPPMKNELLPPPPPLPEPEPSAVTLDDLFRKTKAVPRIYYLPLSDQQVAAKAAAQRKVNNE